MSVKICSNYEASKEFMIGSVKEEKKMTSAGTEVRQSEGWSRRFGLGV